MAVNVDDRISLGALELWLHLGVGERERSRKQRVFIDIDLYTDTREAAIGDDVTKSIDYAKVCKATLQVQERPFKTIECLAQSICDIAKGHGAKRVCVRVKKPQALTKYACAYSEIEVVR